jgi:hypothetical protein
MLRVKIFWYVYDGVSLIYLNIKYLPLFLNIKTKLNILSINYINVNDKYKNYFTNS